MTIPTGFFTDLTKNYYGIDPMSHKAEDIQASETLWENFLSQVSSADEPYINIISSNDELTVDQALISVASTYMSPLSDTVQADLALLAQALVTNRGEALSDLTSSDPQKVQALLTNLISSQVSPTDPFITTLLPSIAEDIATKNTATQKLYFEYLANQLKTTNLSEASNALSPQETTKRHLTYTIFDILYTLLTTMSASQILSANSEMPLINKKQEYVNMMKKLFMYQSKGDVSNTSGALFQDPTTGKVTLSAGLQIGTEESVLTRPVFSDDPSKYNLGYGSITLQDIFDYVYTNAVGPLSPTPQTTQGTGTGTPKPLTPSSTFELDSSLWIAQTGPLAGNVLKNRCVISVTKDPDTGVFTVSTTFDQPRVDGPKKGTDSQKFVYTQTVTPTSDQTAETQVMAALQSTFYSAYGDGNTAGWVQLNSANPTTTTGTTTADLNTVLPELKIPWGFESSDAGNIGYLFPAPINTTDPTLSATSNTASQTRAQKNQVLNNYLQSINSQISLLNDKVDSQSQMQNAASTEKSQITNVVETILRQLKDILTSIYPS